MSTFSPTRHYHDLRALDKNFGRHICYRRKKLEYLQNRQEVFEKKNRQEVHQPSAPYRLDSQTEAIRKQKLKEETIRNYCFVSRDR
jgi:hypothetical protein